MKYLIATSLFFKILSLSFFPIGIAQEEKYLLRMVKEDQIEKKLMSSEVFKVCANKAKSAATLDEQIKITSECIRLEVAGLDKSKVENLLNNLELSKTELYGDRNQKNLSDYLSTLVQKALYGDAHNQPGALNKINQEMFTLVYERVVGKALFLELAQYCLEKMKANKLKDKISIESIVNNLTTAETEVIFTDCRKSIQNSCELNPKTQSIDYANTQACIFNRRLVEFKTIMNEIKKDKLRWQEARENSKSFFTVTNLDAKIGKQRSLGDISNDLTNLSSSQIVDDGYQEKNQVLKKQAEEMELKCKNAVNRSDEDCKDFFNRGIGESLGQYRLQKELELELKIKNLEDSNLGQLKETASKSNYFSKDQLAALLNGTEEEIKKAIQDKYIAERDSIKKDINDRINKIGVNKKEDLNEAGRKITNIHELLKDRPDELRAINFFSSVVMANFTFKKDTSGKKRVFSGIDKEKEDLQKKNQDPEVQKALKYLEGFKTGRTAASIEEDHFFDADEIDYLLYKLD